MKKEQKKTTKTKVKKVVKKEVKKALKKPIKSACKKDLNVFILLDRSGSMSHLWNELTASINTYVANLKKDKAKDKITLVTFDGHSEGMSFDILRDRVDINDWVPMTPCESTPRGMTPLYDAFAKIVEMAKCDNKEKTAIVVVTDGEENNSHCVTHCRVKELVSEIECKNWQLNFLGANFDNSRQTQSLGVSYNYTLCYNTGSASGAFTSTSALHSNYRGCATACCYTQADRDISNEDAVKGSTSNTTVLTNTDNNTWSVSIPTPSPIAPKACNKRGKKK